MSRAVRLAPWVIGGGAAGDLLSASIPGEMSTQTKDAIGIGAGAAVGGGVGFGMQRGGVDRQTSVGVGGGIAGGTTTAAVRERFDVKADGSPRTLFGDPGTPLGTLGMPSVAWGLGTGLASLGLWWADFSGMATTAPRDMEELWLGYGLGGVAAGTVSALMPKAGASTAISGFMPGQGQTRTQAGQRTLRQPSTQASSDGGGGGGGGDTISEFAPAQ